MRRTSAGSPAARPVAREADPRYAPCAVAYRIDDSRLGGAERDAKAILKGLGLDAYKIATSSERSADFAVDGDEPAYLVEVKSRLPDERLSKPAARVGEPVSKSMRHDPKVGSWLAESQQQFKPLDPDHERLWFLWCSMESPVGGPNQVERAVSFLYGAREACDIMPPHRTTMVFYAKPAAFDRFPAVDGAVVVWPDGLGMTFCPNEASPRFDATMRSKLVGSLRRVGVGPMLPDERAAATNGCVVPAPIRSADDAAILHHVQRVKRLPYLTFNAMDVEVMRTAKIALPGRDGKNTSRS